MTACKAKRKMAIEKYSSKIYQQIKNSSFLNTQEEYLERTIQTFKLPSN